MSEETKDGTDQKLPEGVVAIPVEDAGSDDSDPKPFLSIPKGEGDAWVFKTPEEAAKAFLEKEKFIGKQGSEKGELKKRLEELEAKLQAQSQQPPKADPSTMSDEEYEKAAERLGMSVEAVKVLVDMEQSEAKEREKLRNELKAELMEEITRKSDSVYQTHKDQVDAMVKAGVPFGTAVDLFRNGVIGSAVHPDRPAPPADPAGVARGSQKTRLAWAPWRKAEAVRMFGAEAAERMEQADLEKIKV